MSFNIRYGTAPDGMNAWEQRKSMCLSRIAAAVPDLVGLQEALGFQNDFLIGNLPGFTRLGVAREDGGSTGEFTTLLFRSARFSLAASGTFWLSATPEVAGSRSWDSAYPRIATWARLHDLAHDGREFVWINTHFDHVGEAARLASARLIRSFAADQRLPAIVTGDFNDVPGSAPYRALLERTDDGLALADAGPVGGDRGTFHGFGTVLAMPCIDWILTSAGFSITTSTIDRYHEASLFPSDHFPVVTVLHWQ
jgi:endonuclease/exonuclease/phosphatase family metal-dependent hydrolase